MNSYSTQGHVSPISLLLVAGLLSVLPGDALAGTALDRIRQSGNVTIGYRESSIPFSFVDENKKPMGYAVDLCLKVMGALSKKIKKPLTPSFVMVTSTNRIALVAEGKVDLECGSTTNNADRRQKVAFTVPHYITGARFMVRADSNFSEFKDFYGHRLVSTKGSTPLQAIRKATLDSQVKIQILEASEHAAAFAMVEKGQADGFVMDDVLLYGLISGHLDPSKFKVVGKFLTIEPLAIAFSKDDTELKKIIDDELRHLIRTREAHAIFDRWFNQPIPPRNKAMNLPMNYLLKDFWKFPTDKVP